MKIPNLGFLSPTPEVILSKWFLVLDLFAHQIYLTCFQGSGWTKSGRRSSLFTTSWIAVSSYPALRAFPMLSSSESIRCSWINNNGNKVSPTGDRSWSILESLELKIPHLHEDSFVLNYLYFGLEIKHKRTWDFF